MSDDKRNRLHADAGMPAMAEAKMAARVTEHDMDRDEFMASLNRLIENGHVERTDDGKLRLTDAGVKHCEDVGLGNPRSERGGDGPLGDSVAVANLAEAHTREMRQKADGPRGGTPRLRVLDPDAASIYKLPPRRYAGAPSFHQAWQTAQNDARVAFDKRRKLWEPWGRIAAGAAVAFTDARPLSVMPEQAKVLPEMTASEMAEYGAIVELPFDPVYVDLTDEDGRCVVVRPADVRALMGEDYENVLMDEVYDEIGIGFSGVLLHQAYEAPPEHANPATKRIGSLPLVAMPFLGGHRDTRRRVAGMYLNLRADDDSYHLFEPDLTEGFHLSNTDAIPAVGVGVYDTGKPSRASVLIAPPDKYLASARQKLLWGGVLLTIVERAMACLYMLESVNVETAPVVLATRDRKRAEKRGWPIADTIRVRTPRRRSAHTHEGNGHREYSHRFDVIGHYKHVQKGPHVRCRVCGGKDDLRDGCERCHGSGLDPALVKPCTRIDEATSQPTCPRGCRREYVPPTVKGPDDKPYIPKSRMVTRA